MSYAPVNGEDDRDEGNGCPSSTMFRQDHTHAAGHLHEECPSGEYLHEPSPQHHPHSQSNPLLESVPPQGTLSRMLGLIPPQERISSDDLSSQNTVKPESTVASEPVITSKWTIGWKVPTLICTLYTIAAGIACAHLLLFKWLDSQLVDHAIRQSYVTAISTAFVTAFRTSLEAGLIVCFTQLLWRLLRIRAMRVSTIDSLFSITSNPWKLASTDVLLNAPLLCSCAILCWCIPIAMIYPPGALIVESRAYQSSTDVTVPTFDPNFRGNGTKAGMQENMLFFQDDVGNYMGPTIAVSRIAKQTMLGGTYLTAPSPCGQNCSYAVNVIGPSFDCVDGVDFEKIMSHLNSSGSIPLKIARDTFVFIAAPNYGDGWGSNRPRGLDRFEIQWRNTIGGNLNGTLHNLSCFAYESSYTMNVSYLEGRQTVTAQLHQGKVLDTTNMAHDLALNPVQCADNATTCIITDSTISVGAGNISIPALFRSCNVMAVKETVVDALTGVLTASAAHGPILVHTMINQCAALSSGSGIPTFSLSAATMQSLLQNVTISMLTLANTNVTVYALQTNFVNVYVFAHPKNLLLPYFLSLAVSLFFIVTAFVALLRNGVAAMAGGFLQLVCTTSGSEELDKAAAGGCLGGMENVPEELKKLKVQFGELLGSGHQVVRRAGFGVVGEVTTLDKGKCYGG